MAYYTGIDVSLRSVSICVIDDTGQVALEAKVAADVDAIVKVLQDFDPRARSLGGRRFDARLREVTQTAWRRLRYRLTLGAGRGRDDRAARSVMALYVLLRTVKLPAASPSFADSTPCTRVSTRLAPGAGRAC